MPNHHLRPGQDMARRRHRGERAFARLGVAGVSIVALSGLWPAAASAQNLGLGYVFGGLGAATFTCCGGPIATFHIGGGGERLIGDTVRIGGEIGYMGSVESFGDGVAVLSANGAYHFPLSQRERKARPFITGGYTIFFPEGNANVWNVGGGFDYWAGRRAGLRVELRDHVFSEDGGIVHAWGVRLGVLFR